MAKILYSLDLSVFNFVNQTLGNPLGDFVWPYVTDYVTFWSVRIVLLFIWLWLLLRGGRRGRAVACLLVVTILCSDQLSSAVIKYLVARPRPCHGVDGVQVVPTVHLLVGCGSGKSFPSSHAVNNFAAATVLSFYYRRYLWGFFAWAGLVAVSRIAVGVHYPSDILGGALIGVAVAAVVLWLWTSLEKRIMSGSIAEPAPRGGDP